MWQKRQSWAKKGGEGPVGCDKLVKAVKGSGLPPLPSTPEMDKKMPKKEKDVLDDQKVMGPPFMGFISLAEKVLDPEEDVSSTRQTRK